MREFTDSQGRKWEVAVNVWTLKRVRDLVRVDLLEIADGKTLRDIVGDDYRVCDIAYALCKREADQRCVTDEDFGRALDGGAIRGATNAIAEELLDFFRSRAGAVGSDASPQKTNGEGHARLGGISTSVPESAALTPDHLPCAS